MYCAQTHKCIHFRKITKTKNRPRDSHCSNTSTSSLHPIRMPSNSWRDKYLPWYLIWIKRKFYLVSLYVIKGRIQNKSEYKWAFIRLGVIAKEYHQKWRDESGVKADREKKKNEQQKKTYDSNFKPTHNHQMNDLFR